MIVLLESNRNPFWQAVHTTPRQEASPTRRWRALDVVVVVPLAGMLALSALS